MKLSGIIKPGGMNKMDDKLQEISKRFQTVEEEMSKPENIADQNLFRELNRERSQLAPIIQKYEEYRKAKDELSDSRELISEEEDPEMKDMLQTEIQGLEETITAIEDKLLVLLMPKDPNSGKDIIMEIRAGTGGDEAGLFVADLFRMYSRYSDIMGWKIEVFNTSPTEVGGFKEITFSIRSTDAWDSLKFESGVHRVQRVPSTETQGRVHTSAVSVVVLSEAEENEIELDQNDLRFDVYRASGHGGQSVNTTDSAVRITHIPTGMIVTCQDEKSQHKNKAKALRVLKARLLEKSNQEKMAKNSELRKAQIGSGDRSERIRTYNFPQSRITDHRIGLTLYSLDAVMDGEMQEVVDALQKHEVEQMLKVMNK